MRFSYAFGRSLASSGIVLLAAGLASPLSAQPSHRADRETIHEMAAPRRQGFDEIIVQLPPLAPVRRNAQKAAAPTPAAPAKLEAAKQVSEPLAEAPIEAAKPAVDASIAAAVSTPVAMTPDMAAAPVESPAQPILEKAREAAASARAVEPAPAEPAPSVSATPAEPVAAPAPAVATEAAAEPAAAAESPAQTEPSEEAVADPAAQSAVAAAPVHEEQTESSWADYALYAAVLGLLGFVAVQRLKVRRSPAAPAPVVKPAPVAVAEPAPKTRGRLAGLSAGFLVLRDRLAASALLARLRKLRRGKATKQAEAEAAAEWAQLSATLRARATSAVSPAAATQDEDEFADAEAAASVLVASEAPPPKADVRTWDQDREDGVELLEPGSPSARALVMSARRKLQTVGQR